MAVMCTAGFPLLQAEDPVQGEGLHQDRHHAHEPGRPLPRLGGPGQGPEARREGPGAAAGTQVQLVWGINGVLCS